MAEIRPLVLLVPCADVGSVRVVCVRREPAFDGLPVERLVPVPVVLGRGDDGDDRKSRCLEDHDRPLQRRPRVTTILVVLGERKTPPVRLADSDMAAGTDGRRQRIHGLGEVAEDEARSEAESRVVGLGLERRACPVTKLERDQLGDSGLRRPRECDGMELGRDLDPAARCSRTLPPAGSPGLPRPEAMSSTLEPGSSPSRLPRSSSFSRDVGFWISCVASATT